MSESPWINIPQEAPVWLGSQVLKVTRDPDADGSGVPRLDVKGPLAAHGIFTSAEQPHRGRAFVNANRYFLSVTAT